MSIKEYQDKFGTPTISQEYKDNHWSKLQNVYSHPMLGIYPDKVIADECQTFRRNVTRARERQNIAKPKGRYISQEGLHLRSYLEAMYDCYLHEFGIPHEHEGTVSGSGYLFDFKIGDIYIEVEGIVGNPKFKVQGLYKAKKIKKNTHYLNQGLSVIWLLPDEVEELYKQCSELTVLGDERVCSRCGNNRIANLTKGLCDKCYRTFCPRYLFTCETCGVEFTRNQKSRRFCGTDCWHKAGHSEESKVNFSLRQEKVREDRLSSCQEFLDKVDHLRSEYKQRTGGFKGFKIFTASQLGMDRKEFLSLFNSSHRVYEMVKGGKYEYKEKDNYGH